jgi:membrane-associated phospholipid phosphatase
MADDQHDRIPQPRRPDATNDPGLPGELREDRFVGAEDLTRWRSPVGRGLARAAHALAARLGPHGALVLTLAFGSLLAVLLTVLFSEVYESVTEADGVAGLDHPLLQTALGLRSPFADSAVTAYTDIGGVIGMPILALVIMFVLAFRRKSWTPVILMLAAAGGSLLMTIAGKQLFGRSRPPLADAVPPYEYSPSFPSGHSLNALVIAGIVAYLLILRQHSTRARVLTVTIAALFAFTIGLSRVFLGHHWFTDVLAAWILGAAWLSLVITAHRLYLTVRHHASPAMDTGPPAT